MKNLKTKSILACAVLASVLAGGFGLDMSRAEAAGEPATPVFKFKVNGGAEQTWDGTDNLKLDSCILNNPALYTGSAKLEVWGEEGAISDKLICGALGNNITDSSGNVLSGLTIIFNSGTVNGVYGRYSTGGENLNGETVIINGGIVKGGSSSISAAGVFNLSNGNANNGTLNINGGTFYNHVSGGYTRLSPGDANNNIVNITAGTFMDERLGYRNVWGGYSASGNANENKVNISGGYGNTVYGGDGSGNTNYNEVNISGGEYENIFGGHATDGNAKDNIVRISGGKIFIRATTINSAKIVGGWASNGVASNNKVILSGGDLSTADVYGWYTAKSHSDNTLQIENSVSVSSVNNFENLNFVLQENINDNDTMLALGNGVSLGSEAVNVYLNGQERAAITLIDKASGSLGDDKVHIYTGKDGNSTSTEGYTVTIAGNQLILKNKNAITWYQVGSEEKWFLTGTEAQSISDVNGDVTIIRGASTDNAYKNVDVGSHTLTVAGADDVNSIKVTGNLTAGALDVNEGKTFKVNGSADVGQVTLGAGATVIATGDFSGENMVSVGKNNTMQALNTVALGSNAVVSGENSVAIGNNSVAFESNTVSVGSSGAERRIVNVAPGTADHDAVNLAQMNAVQTELNEKIAMTEAQAETKADATKTELSQKMDGLSLSLGQDKKLSLMSGQTALGTPVDLSSLGSTGSLNYVAATPYNSPNDSAFAMEKQADGGGGATAFGYNAKADAAFATALGWGANATKEGATAIGKGSSATGKYALAAGDESKAEGENSTALGYMNEAKSDSSTAVGYFNVVNRTKGAAFGTNNEVTGLTGIALGSMNYVSGDYAITLGSNSKAQEDYSVAMGSYAIANGVESMALGRDSQTGSSAVGAMAFGSSARATKANALAVGSFSESAKRDYAVEYCKELIKRVVTEPAEQGTPFERTIRAITGKNYEEWLAKDTDTFIYDLDNQLSGVSFDNNVMQIIGTAVGGFDGTTASGLNAISIGASTKPQGNMASGNNSIAIGTDARANKNGSIALGAWSVANRDLSSRATDNDVVYELSVGGGTDEDGKTVYRVITNVADGTDAHDAVNLKQMQDAITLATGSMGGGGSSTAPDYIAAGPKDDPVPSATAYGTGSIALGYGAKVIGTSGTTDHSLAVGYNAQVTSASAIAMGDDALAEGLRSVAIGRNAKTTANHSVALGYNSVASEENTVSVGSSVVGGQRRIVNVAAGTADTDAVNLAQMNAAIAGITGGSSLWEAGTGENSVILKGGSNVATGDYSLAVGKENTASGETSAAIGLQNTASGQASVAMGFKSTAEGNYSLAAGYSSRTEGGASVAIGAKAVTKGYAAVSLGEDTVANTNAVALGYKTKAEGKGATATGYGSEAYGEGSFAGGGHVTNTQVVGGKAYGESSFAFGTGAAAGSVSYAPEDTQQEHPIYGGNYTFAFGNNALASKDNAIALGSGAKAEHANSVALGSNSVTVADNTLAIGDVSNSVFRRITGLAEGVANTDAATVGQVYSLWTKGDSGTGSIKMTVGNNAATHDYSLAVGKENTASGEASTAMGYKSTAGGNYSLAAGYGAKTVGGAAIALGTGTFANGYAAIALGQDTEAKTNAVALGYKTKAEAKGSTAVGYGSEALGEGSFAGGGHVTNTQVVGGKAYGESSFAFGTGAVAGASGGTGNYTFAFGSNALASMDNAIALGSGARAEHANSVALGSNSVTSAENTISIGYAGGERRITNVAAGTADTDAATVAQLKAKSDYYVKGGNVRVDGINNKPYLDLNIFNNATGASVDTISIDVSSIGGGSVISGDKILTPGTNIGFTPYTDPADAQVKYAVGLTDNISGLKSVVIGTATKNIYLDDDGVSVTGTGSLTDSHLASVMTADRFYLGEGNLDTVTNSYVGAVYSEITKNTLKINQKTYINENGIDANGQKIVNVANGVNDRDAVNYGQLKNAVNTLSYDSNTKKISFTTVGDSTVQYLDLSGLGGGISDAYTKTETDAKLADKANTTDVYSKTEVDTALGSKANTTDVYSKTEVDTALGSKANTADVYAKTDTYSKTEVNTELAKKADKSTTLTGYGITDAYTKTEVDGLLAGVAPVVTEDKTALGKGSEVDATAKDATALGSDNKVLVNSKDSTAVGKGNEISGERSTAIGNGLKVHGKGSGAFGDPTIVNGDNSYSVGNNNYISADSTYVFGSNVGTEAAPLTAENSVVLGNNSFAKVISEVDGTNGVVSVGAEGKERRITNVRDGVLASDAATYGQLVQTAGQLSSQIDRMGTRISKVGAGAAALAAMHPVYDPESKLTFSAGVGNYKSETAAAVGLFYRFDDRVMLNFGASVGNDNDMYNMGLNFALGRHTPKGLPTKQVMYQQLISLQTLLNEQKAENAAMHNENSTMRELLLKQSAENAAIKEQIDAQKAQHDAQIAQLLAMIEELKNR